MFTGVTIWVLTHGSKLSRKGYAGFGPCFHLPGFHFGTVFFLSHSFFSFFSPSGAPKPLICREVKKITDAFHDLVDGKRILREALSCGLHFGLFRDWETLRGGNHPRENFVGLFDFGVEREGAG